MEKDLSFDLLWENLIGDEEVENQNALGDEVTKTFLLQKILSGLDAITYDSQTGTSLETTESLQLLIKGKRTVHIALSDVYYATLKDALLWLGVAFSLAGKTFIPASIALASSLIISATKAVTILPSDDGSACFARVLACCQTVNDSSACSISSVLELMQYRACSIESCQYFSGTKCIMNEGAAKKVLNFLISKKVVEEVGVETYGIKK